MDRNRKRSYRIDCTPNEFSMLLYWAYEGIDTYTGADGWKIEDIEEVVDKVAEQVRKQETA